MIFALLLVFADDPRVEEARGYYRQAETHYKLGRFDSALALFQKAYEVKPNPVLLFNIGQCHFHLKDYDRAIFFYEGFLREAPPNAPARFKANAQLADARREAAKQKREARDRPVVVQAPVSQPVEQPRTIVVSRPAPPPPAPAPAASVEVSTPVYKKWWFWTIIGVAVAGGAAAATTVYLLNQPRVSEIDWRMSQ